jgi:hypothetical protein
MRYNDPRLFEILGGEEAMIESPVLQEFLAKRTREAFFQAKRQSIIQVLVARFGMDALSIGPALDAIRDDEKLEALTKRSALCHELDAFKDELLSAKATGADQVDH